MQGERESAGRGVEVERGGGQSLALARDHWLSAGQRRSTEYGVKSQAAAQERDQMLALLGSPPLKLATRT